MATVTSYTQTQIDTLLTAAQTQADARYALANTTAATWRPIGSGAQPVYVTAPTAAGSYTGGTATKRIRNGPNTINVLRVTWGNYVAGAQEAHAVATTLSASTSPGATTITTPISIAAGTVIVIQGANTETVTTTGAPTGTGPYTIPVPALVSSHTSGVQILVNYATVTLQTAALEYPQGVFTPIGIRGGAGAAMAAGFDVISDPVGVTIPPNVDFWVRTYATWPAQTNVALQQMPTYSNQSADLSATPSDKTQAVGNVGFQTIGIAPVRVEALVPTTSKTLLADGDSITNGTGNGPDFGIGYVDLACAGIVDLQKLAAPTTRAVYEAAQATRWRKARLVPGTTAAYENYGINDISNGRTLTQLQGDKIAIWQWLASVQGVRRVYCGTLVPLSSASTDGWTTVAGQTIFSGETIRTALNSWIRDGAPLTSSTNLTPAATGTVGALRAGQAGHPLTGYVDVAAAVEVNSSNALTLNGGYWRTVTGRTVTDGAMTSGTSVLTSATAAFTSADAGRVITVAGAGTAGGLYVGVVQTVNSATQVTFNRPGSPTASTTVSAATVRIGYAWTSDGTHPSTEAHQAMAAPFTAAIAALTA